MKVFIIPTILVFAFVACKKNKDVAGNGTNIICFDTTSLRINITEVPQSIFFVNAREGFLAGYNGGIYKTTDSAKSWTLLNTGITLPVYSLFFTDAQQGFAVGGQLSCNGVGCISPGGFILKTLNGGQTWIKVYTPAEKIEITSVYFINASTGFCVGNNVIFKTTNGGQTWSEYKLNNLGGKLGQIKFVNNQVGYIVGLAGKIVKTEDGGINWTVQSTNANIGYSAIATFNSTIYFAGQGKISKSTIGNSSWNDISILPHNINVLHFISDKKGFAFGSGNYSGGDFGYTYGSIYCTDNGGLTWNGTGDVKTGYIRSASFPSNDIAYALSSSPFTGFRVIRLTLK